VNQCPHYEHFIFNNLLYSKDQKYKIVLSNEHNYKATYFDMRYQFEFLNLTTL